MLFPNKIYFYLNYLFSYNFLLKNMLIDLNNILKLKNISFQSFIVKNLKDTDLKKINKTRLSYQKNCLLLFYCYFLKKFYYKHFLKNNLININLKFKFSNYSSIFQFLYLVIYENNIIFKANSFSNFVIRKGFSNFFFALESSKLINLEILKKTLFKNFFEKLDFRISFVIHNTNKKLLVGSNFFTNLPFFYYK